MFPSGAWRGFYEYSPRRRDWMQPLTLEFSAGRVQGHGHDPVGAFTFEGEYQPTGEVTLVKQYTGGHDVVYIGRVDGEGAIVGRWTISTWTTGEFALMPERASAASLPIAEVAFVD